MIENVLHHYIHLSNSVAACCVINVSIAEVTARQVDLSVCW